MAQPPGNGSTINRDLGPKLSHAPSVQAVLGKNNTTGNGVGVDLKGYEGARMVLQIGTSGDTIDGSNYFTCVPQHSDESAANFSNLTAGTHFRIDGGANNNLQIASSGQCNKTVPITLLAGSGVKRYVKMTILHTGTHTNGTPYSCDVVRGFPRVET